MNGKHIRPIEHKYTLPNNAPKTRSNTSQHASCFRNSKQFNWPSALQTSLGKATNGYVSRLVFLDALRRTKKTCASYASVVFGANHTKNVKKMTTGLQVHKPIQSNIPTHLLINFRAIFFVMLPNLHARYVVSR